MEDKEFDNCNKKLRSLISRDKQGKRRKEGMIEILEWVFRQGYEFAKEDLI